MKEVGVRLKVAATGLENVQALSKELNSVGVETTALDSKAAELAAELKRLAAEQGLIDNFKRQKQAVADAGAAMEAAKEKAGALGREIGNTEEPTKRQEAAFTKARVAARAADDAYTAQQSALQTLRGQMAAAGVATDALAAAQVRVHSETQRLKDGLVSAEAAATGMVAGQKQLAATASDAQVRARALADNLQALQQGFRGAGGEATAMGQHLDTAFRTVGIRAVKEIEGEIAQLKAALFSIKAADPFGPDVQRAVAATEARIKALEGELRQVPAAAASATTGLHGVADGGASLGTSLASATSKAVAMGAALIGISSAGQVAAGVLHTAEAFETLRVRLEQVLGSSKAAETQFSAIKKLAIETPFEVSALTETYIRLANFGLKPTQSQMLALADTAAVAGGGTEALQRVTLALGQAWAKTRLQGDEILQLTEAGVPVWDLLAKATGKNVTELRNLSEQGALGRDVILKLFDAMGEKNAGASVRLMATFAGTVSNAKDAMAEFFDLIGRSGVLEHLTKKLQEALAEFDRMKDTGELERKAKKIADAFIAFADGVELVFVAVRKLADVLPILLAAMVASKVIAFADSLRGVGKAAEAAAVATRLAAIETEVATVKMGTAGVASAGVATGLRAVGTAAPVAAAGMATAGTAAGGAAAGATLLARAVGLLGVALRFAGITGVILGVAALAAKFYEAKKGADDADEASRKLLAGPPANQQGAKQAVHDVVSELEDFRKNLPKLESDISALTGEGLAAVAKTTIENLRAIKAEGTDMGKAILTISERAAQVLGIELPSQAAKASIGFNGVRAEVDVLIGQLPNLKLSAQDAGNVVAQAMNKMVDAATTKKDFEQVSKTIKELADAGRIGPGAVAELLLKATDRARELKEKVEANTPGIQSLGEAARKAGVETELLTTGLRKGFTDDLKPVSDLVTEIVKAGVEASRASPILAEAFDKRIQAAKTREEMAALTAEIIRARDAGYDFGSAISRELDKAKEKAAALIPEMQRLQEWAKRLGIELAGINGSKPSAPLTNPDGSQKGSNSPAGSLSGDPFANFGKQQGPITGTYDIGALGALQLKQRAGTLSASDLGTADAGIAATKYNIEQLQNMGRTNPAAIGFDAYSSLERMLSQLQELRAAIVAQQPPSAAPSSNNGPAGTSGSASQAAQQDFNNLGIPKSAVPVSATPSGAGQARTVNINIAGLTSTSVNVASDADAARLEAMLRALATAAARSA